MNLDPNNALDLFDGKVYDKRDMRYWVRGLKLYSQDETLCLLGLIEEGVWGSELPDRFNQAHPGRTRTSIKMKVNALKKKRFKPL